MDSTQQQQPARLYPEDDTFRLHCMQRALRRSDAELFGRRQAYLDTARKIAARIIGAGLVATLAACGGGSPTTNPPDQSATRAPASLQMPAGPYAAGQVLSTELLAQSYTNTGAAPVQVACSIKTSTEYTIGGGYSGRMSAGIEVNATLDGVPQPHARVPVDIGSADAPTDALQLTVPPGATVECVSRLAFYALTAGTKLAPAATLSVSHIQARLQVLP